MVEILIFPLIRGQDVQAGHCLYYYLNLDPTSYLIQPERYQAVRSEH